MKCRFLYVVGGLGAGGLERQLYLLLKTMDRKLFTPAVVAWSFCEDETYVSQIRELGVPIHSLGDATSKLSKLRALRRLVTRIKPEVIHSYGFYTNFAVWWAAQRTSAAAVGGVRSDFIFEQKESGSVLGRLSGRWPRNQISNNHLAAHNACRSHSFFVPKRIQVVRNGIDLESFQMVPLPADKLPCLLAVGSLLPVKRWDRLLVAAAELKARGFDFQVRVAGDGPLRESLEQQARDLGIADQVQFLGYSANIPVLLADAICLIHTSDVEGSPNVVIEAMACGRAVVATDSGDIPSLVENGKTGFVVPRGDDAMLIERLATLIANRELCRKMGDSSRAKAEAEFPLDRLVENTLAAYRAAGWSGR